MSDGISPATRADGGLAALRDSAGLAERSEVGRLYISGADALDLLNRLTTNKLEDLPAGHACATVLTNGDARVIDLLELGALDDGLLCLTSPGCQQTVVDWLDTYTFGEEIVVEDRTATTFQITLAGPEARRVLESTGAAVGHLELDRLCRTVVDGADVVVWRTRSGGADGYEIVGELPERDAVHNSLTVATPVSAGEWEAYRIQNGMPAVGAEFGTFTNPLESRLLGAVSDDKGCYTGQEVIARLQTYRKVQRKLMAVSLSGSAEAGSKLTASGGSAGELTSVAGTSAGAIGLALIPAKLALPGAVLDVASDTGISVQATLAEPAFALATEPPDA